MIIKNVTEFTPRPPATSEADTLPVGGESA